LTLRLAWLSCLWLAAAAAQAEAPAPVMPAAGAATAQVALSLLVVLALVGALAWLARRLRFAPHRSDGDLRVLADLALGPRERLVLLQVGDRQALVGVSGAGIASVQLLEEAVTLGPAAAGAPAAVAERMRALLQGRGRA
jgi:flagellar protein FliO/FliZ